MTLSALREILAEHRQRVLDRCALSRSGDPGRDLCDQHHRTAPVSARAGRATRSSASASSLPAGVVVKGGGRVVKNVAGYDFPKLLTGSMGTLGIITQLTLKVRPIPEASAIAWVPFANATEVDRDARPSQHLRNATDRHRHAQRRAGSTVGQGLGLAHRRTNPRGRLRGQRPFGPLAARSLERRAGRQRSRRLEGERAEPLWERSASFRPGSSARSASSRTCVPRSLRPSWSSSIRSAGRSRRMPAMGSSAPMRWATGPWRAAAVSDRLHRQAARQGGGNLDPLALPDRVEGTPPRLGRAGRTGRSANGSRRLSTPTEP